MIYFIASQTYINLKHTYILTKIADENLFFTLSTEKKNAPNYNNYYWHIDLFFSPDAVITAGDMITAQSGEKYKTAEALMVNLARKYPIYYGIGNHEHHLATSPDKFGNINIYEKYMDALREAGIEPLINESIRLPSSNINVCGLQLDRRYFAKFRNKEMPENYLNDLMGRADMDSFQILIAHNPDYFADYAKWGADLVLSGHVHGGLMKLPVLGGVISPKLTLFPHYDGGRFEYNDCVMILSRGLGTHTLPIRIFNPGELVFVRLKPKI